MAKVSYVPYSDDYAALFAFCGITLATQDYNGKEGWDAAQFASAAQQAWDYLIDHYDDDPDLIDSYMDMLDNYSVAYWSTEKPIYG